MRPLIRFLLFSIPCFLFIGELLLYRAFAQDNPDPTRFAEEIEAFREWDRKNTPPDSAVLFVGSSSIRMWPTAQLFPGHVVMNRGFGGSQISDVNYYLTDVVTKYRPRVVVFYAGDNDIAAGKTPERVLLDYQRFTEMVHENLRDLPILYLPIKPSPSRWEYWPSMKKANELIFNYSDQHPHLYYVDLATPMLKETGEPDSSLFLEDMLHLNEAGYTLWTNTLKPRLEELTISNEQ